MEKRKPYCSVCGTTIEGTEAVEGPDSEYKVKVCALPCGHMIGAEKAKEIIDNVFDGIFEKFNAIQYIQDYHNHKGDKYLETLRSRVYSPFSTCGVCGKMCKLVVDHSHTTEKVRGRLCNMCNIVLGMCGDTENDILAWSKQAILYLRKSAI